VSPLHSTRIVLASASPRRAELLRAAGFEFDVMPANVDESIRRGEVPLAYVSRLADAKARAVHAQVPARTVLAADTVVVIDAHILGKPIDVDDARRMLQFLSGRVHEVLTAVTVLAPDRPPVTRADRTSVQFAHLTDREIDWYVDTREPMDKAGAYAVQGLASRFVTRIEGSYSNVVGLPISLVYQMLNG
jgi:septum formation protein